MMLSGWGRFPRADCRMLAPRDEAGLRAALLCEPSVIVRGNGRSYGDPAMNPKATFCLRQADRFKSFDPATGLLEAEAGVLLPDIIETFLPRGWFIPVTPGTKFVTLGGMIAADVHGKNHHGAGSFGDHVQSLELMLADGRILRCSNDENRELFDATRGGMGLTGVIRSAVIRMLKVQSAYIRQETIRTRNLAETMEAFEQSRGWTYTVAWIDSLARGRKLGRCVLYRGEHARADELPAQTRKQPLALAPRRAKAVPFDFPRLALNRWTVWGFNTLYYALARPGTAIVDYDTYFYPLDAIADWNRIYGRAGFLQYQCVLPTAASRQGLTDIMTRVARAGTASFLSVLKLLGPGRGMLSFPMEGYTLALDFPATQATFALLTELDAVVEAHGGRIYLAKDARMGAAMLQRGYGELEAFKALRHAADPSGKFKSLQSERLGL
jgi:FAD/FMN-containing dehydrogenase